MEKKGKVGRECRGVNERSQSRVSMRSCKGKVSACLPPCCQDSSTKLHQCWITGLNTGLSKNSSKTREGSVTCPLYCNYMALKHSSYSKKQGSHIKNFSEDVTMGARIYLIGHKSANK